MRAAASLALLLLLAVPAAQAQTALPTGAPLPLADRAMPTAAGAPPSSSLQAQMGERGLAVVFWSNACPWVRRYEERLAELHRTFGPRGVPLVAVHANDPADNPAEALPALRQRSQEAAYPFHVLVDERGEVARAFGASRTPQVFVFDGAGRLVYEGAIDDSPSEAAQVREPHLRRVLEQLAEGRPVTVERTRAFGCTIRLPG